MRGRWPRSGSWHWRRSTAEASRAAADRQDPHVAWPAVEESSTNRERGLRAGRHNEHRTRQPAWVFVAGAVGLEHVQQN
jgi:hypothetical protein